MLYIERKYIFIQLVVLLMTISSVSMAQQSTIYTEEYTDYRTAQDLFDKEHFSAAQEKFFMVIEEIDNLQDEIRINSEYYAAICAWSCFIKTLSIS